jgi:hypothetical protein
MAKYAGISFASVGRIWRAHGLKPHIVRGFKLSNDPQFIERARDIVGLYMTPPTNAVVYAFDEKPQIQALKRAQPILPMDIGMPEHQTHNNTAAAQLPPRVVHRPPSWQDAVVMLPRKRAARLAARSQ